MWALLSGWPPPPPRWPRPRDRPPRPQPARLHGKRPQPEGHAACAGELGTRRERSVGRGGRDAHANGVPHCTAHARESASSSPPETPKSTEGTPSALVAWSYAATAESSASLAVAAVAARRGVAVRVGACRGGAQEKATTRCARSGEAIGKGFLPVTFRRATCHGHVAPRMIVAHAGMRRPPTGEGIDARATAQRTRGTRWCCQLCVRS